MVIFGMTKLLFTLFILLSIIGVSNGQPTLESNDKAKIIQTYNLDEKYRNWTIYEINVKKYTQAEVTILNLTEMNGKFEWKMDNVDRYNQIDFLIDSSVFDSCRSSDFVPIRPFKVIPGNEFKLRFWPMGNNDIKFIIAFPPTITSRNEIIRPNSPPSAPEILSEPSKRYNGSVYDFLVRSVDPDSDKLKYSINWGDGNTSTSELLPSGDYATLNHSWCRAGVYNIAVLAIDEKGAESAYTQMVIEISLREIEIITPNSPPSTPEILSEPSKRYNGSVYDFLVRSVDPDSDKLKYSINWGDGNTSTSELLPSGDYATLNHSWCRAGAYNVTALAIDEKGAESAYTQRKIEVSWLLMVPPGAQLQNIFNNISNNTTVILEGESYTGGFDIINLSQIDVSPKDASCHISSPNTSQEYVLGIENSDNITIHGLSISGGNVNIYLQNSSNCIIDSNSMNFLCRGVHVFQGNSNRISSNYIAKMRPGNESLVCAGISIEDSSNISIKCNDIDNLDTRYDPMLYIRNSTVAELKLIIPAIHGIIIQYDSAQCIPDELNGDECCCNVSETGELNCAKCAYETDHGSPHENCSLPINRLGICNESD